MIRLPDGQMRRIYIIGVEGNNVRLSIEAPDSVEIIREELLAPEARAEWNKQQARQRAQPSRRARKLPLVVIAMATMGAAATLV